MSTFRPLRGTVRAFAVDSATVPRPSGLNQTAIPYDGRNLRFYRRAQEAAEHAQLLVQLALEEGCPQLVRPSSQASAADPTDLRGVPVVGRGIGGAMYGTNPEGETIRRDEQRRRRGV